jgi:hypothetical protein
MFHGVCIILKLIIFLGMEVRSLRITVQNNKHEVHGVYAYPRHFITCHVWYLVLVEEYFTTYRK